MSYPLSLTAKGISCLAAWRNPAGSEELWAPREPKLLQFPSYWRIAAAEGGFALFTVAGVVETVFAGCLFIGCGAARLASSKAHTTYKWSQGWIESTAFCTVWSLFYLYLNLVMPNLYTEKGSAAEHGDMALRLFFYA